MKAGSSVALIAIALALFIGAAHPPGALAQGGTEKTSADRIKAATGKVDGASIRANARTARDWPSHRARLRGDALQPARPRSTPTTSRHLGLVWAYDLESTRGVEATPLVVDGVMYVTASWSVVHAIDVRTGKRLWIFDPEVPRETGYKGCCDVVNRGVARLPGQGLRRPLRRPPDRARRRHRAGAVEKDTIIDRARSYTITGAPRVYKGKVIIGNGGAEYGVRGYVTAYDAETGAQRWRWFTVPGDPAKPLRGRLDGPRGQDLGPGRQVLGGRRRRHGVGHA